MCPLSKNHDRDGIHHLNMLRGPSSYCMLLLESDGEESGVMSVKQSIIIALTIFILIYMIIVLKYNIVVFSERLACKNFVARFNCK